MAITTLTLANKWRPNSLADIVGQDNAVQIVQDSIDSGEFSSAYLLTGKTGCGKTTLALIISAALSCMKGNACGKCGACKAGKSNPDFKHLDAATSGKVDDIRELCKLAYVNPMYGRRVILIDECHMLTGAAAQALLITLENPPANTVFILCTTDPEKLLPTIRNRCTQIALLDVPAPQMVKRMITIVRKEYKAKRKELDKEAIKPGLRMVAELADGSMRQALALLETVINSDMLPATIESRFRSSNKSLVDNYQAAATTVAAVLQGDIKKSICAIRSAEQRSIIYELTNLLDNVIGKMCGYSDSNTYSMRLLRDIVKKEGIDIDINILSLYLARVSDIKYENLYKTTLQNITVVFINEQFSNE